MIEREAVSMRIDAYNAVSQVYKTSAYAKDKSIAVKKTEKDKYELSDTAKVYNTARTAVNEASDVRLDKVNDIKARMSAGTYNISSEAVADKMLESISQPEYTNPNAWINNLSASSYNNQLIIVAANGSYANVAMYNKNNDDTWETIVDTNGYVGVDGVGNASEYAHITPSGIYSLSIAFGVNSNPGTALPYTQVDSSYYWVDDPSSDWYNRFVTTNTTTPDWSSAEHIIDYPVPYAYAIAIDYNTSCVKGAGSAIFLHCSNGNPTYGCVSVPQSAMITILNNIRTGCSIIIDEAYNISDY